MADADIKVAEKPAAVPPEQKYHTNFP